MPCCRTPPPMTKKLAARVLAATAPRQTKPPPSPDEGTAPLPRQTRPPPPLLTRERRLGAAPRSADDACEATRASGEGGTALRAAAAAEEAANARARAATQPP